VVRGEDLHVRGGRTGELETILEGIALNEPLRGRAMEIPLVAVRDADLVTGGMDAEYAGALAGVLDVRTVDPGPHYSGEMRWTTDARRGTEYDHASGRFGGPTGFPGVGFVAAGEATLDGTSMPSLHTRGRDHTRFGTFGWRDDNQMLGWLKLAPTRGRSWALQGLATRRVVLPYDPMWSFDGYVNFCPDGDTLCASPYAGPDSIPGATRYRAADHKTITDERRQALLLTVGAPAGAWRPRATLAWLRSRSVTSLDGRDMHAYVSAANRPVFGGGGRLERFLAYAGDEPYFHRSESDVVALRADLEHRAPKGNVVRCGAGASYQTVAGYEFDGTIRGLIGVDSVRAYRAWAPEGFAFAQTRWEFQGLVMNTGLRLQYFDPGAMQGRTPWPVPARGVWSLAPRIGFAYPISVRNVFSLSYVRVDQSPGRDFLYESRLVQYHRRPLGNPALVPASVISYQMALQHVFDPDWSMQLALFYRDLFGQVGARNVSTRNSVRLKYANADEGHASGFETGVRRHWSEANRLEIHYTYLVAWGTASREEGVPYGTLLGTHALPLGEHPLDWDRRHTITLVATWQPRRHWTLAWDSRVGSGLPWTPTQRGVFEADLSRLNRGRLPWSENTSVALHWRPLGRRASVGVEVLNLFDHRAAFQASVDGYPHPTINTLHDEYSAYRTETGRDGGAWWSERLQAWVPVRDPRLDAAPRAIRAAIALDF
jgi:hypothetical protein